ncbi:uncharacterized protein VTP21DRAFT_5213 [Calcarisporiella thermophila]|uniref:uncharacterized protein n=1 Tax=Calcarisporiella thermophila TaxID=911321 RepID=UPI003743FD0B
MGREEGRMIAILAWFQTCDSKTSLPQLGWAELGPSTIKQVGSSTRGASRGRGNGKRCFGAEIFDGLAWSRVPRSDLCGNGCRFMEEWGGTSSRESRAFSRFSQIAAMHSKTGRPKMRK